MTRREDSQSSATPERPRRQLRFWTCGAFSGIKELSVRQHGGRLGFRPAHQGDGGAIAYQLEDGEPLSVELFQEYGFLPEFIGRFGNICRLEPLSRDVLRQILLDNVLQPLAQEFQLEGVSLTLSRVDIESFVEEAYELQTGARGLHGSVQRAVEAVAFERFGLRRERRSTPQRRQMTA